MIEKAPRRVQGPGLDDVKRIHGLEAERRYRDERADTSKPLSNASIMEWKRRRYVQTDWRSISTSQSTAIARRPLPTYRPRTASRTTRVARQSSSL